MSQVFLTKNVMDIHTETSHVHARVDACHEW